MAEVALPSFHAKPEAYALFNPAEEFLDLYWGGKSFRIPGRNEVGRDPARLDSPEGPPVPGTIVIRDSYTTGLDGQIPKPGSAYNWRAADAIRNLLGIDVQTGKPSGTRDARGITFIPPVTDRETLEAIKRDADRRYADSLFDWANTTIQEHETRVALAKQHGMGIPAPDSDYVKAIAIRDRRQRSLGVMPSEVEEAATETEMDEKAAMFAVAMDMAEKAAKGKDIDKRKLAEELMEDEEVRRHLSRTARQKYRIRKIGETPQKE